MANIATVSIDKCSSNEETINYCRIILLIVDVGTKTLLSLFYSHVPKHTAKGYFASKNLEIKDGKKKRVFDKSQYAKLTCSDPNPDEFDTSLLIKLLQFFKLSPVKLDNLQAIRNEIVGHKSKAELIKQDFESIWVQVENILLDIARFVSGDQVKATQLKIEELKQKVLHVSDREWKIIKAFEEEMVLLSDKVDRNKAEIANLRAKLDRNMENTESLRESVAEKTDKIQKDINRLQDVVQGNQHPDNKGESSIAEKCNGLTMLQHDLIIYYRKVLNKLLLSPLIDEEGYASNFFYFYVKPIIEILSHKGPKGQSPVSFHDIFSSRLYQNIYISSPAGYGKTSFAKYLALIWCQAHLPVEPNNTCFIDEDIIEMRKFKLLFFVFLRDEHQRQCDVDIMIQCQLLTKLANSTTYTELGSKFLQNILTNEKCIIILDGLDEWSHPPGNECTLCNKHIPYIRARPLCTTVTTSRPWKLDVVRLKPEDIDLKLEINGLEDVVKSLISKVLTKLNELHGKKRLAYDFHQELRDKKLVSLSNIPIIVMQLLTVWFDNLTLGKSQCEIYTNMIEFLFKRFFLKKETVVVEENNVDDFRRDRHIPMCFQNKMYCTAHMELLSKLAALACNALFTCTEESSLVFERRSIMKYLTDEEIEIGLAVGILTQEKVLDKISIRQSHVSFIHKTFQEYFAALYAALNPGMVTHVEEKVKRVCCSIEKLFEMSHIFMFLSGFCPAVMLNLYEHLRKTVSEDSSIKRYRATCEYCPRMSNVGFTLRRVQDVMMKCVREVWLNGHKQNEAMLPVSDFFIGSMLDGMSLFPMMSPKPRKSFNLWPDELKFLAAHNPVYSLFVACSMWAYFSPTLIEDILNSVTMFKSIQKLWLTRVSENFLAHLVTQHKHSLNLKPDAWRHLECITLEWVTMSGDMLCSLCDSILQLPKSVKVRLVECIIEPWTKNRMMYISSHPLITVDIDYSYNVWWEKTLLQFHTNKA